MHFTPASVARFWLFWFLSCLLMSLLSGWWPLARRQLRRPRPAWRHRLASGSLARGRWPAIQYHASFLITWDRDQLVLGVLPAIRLAHPPLHLAWSQIHLAQRVPWLLFWRQTELHIDGGYRLRLRGRAGLQAYEEARTSRVACNPDCAESA